MLMIAIITQGIMFAAHVAQNYRNDNYYACSLLALPMLMTSWWYFSRPRPRTVEDPVYIWLVYSLTIVAFQVLTMGLTITISPDLSLIFIAHALTPFIYLCCIFVYDIRRLNDIVFLNVLFLMLGNVFDATDATLTLIQNENKIKNGYLGVSVPVVCMLFFCSSVYFCTLSWKTSKRVAIGLHFVHVIFESTILGLRITMYVRGMIPFTIFIVKNATTVLVRVICMIALCQRERKPPERIPPTAPPLYVEEQFLPRPPTPRFPRADFTENRDASPKSSQTPIPPQADFTENYDASHENSLYPSLKKSVRFTEEPDDYYR